MFQLGQPNPAQQPTMQFQPPVYPPGFFRDPSGSPLHNVHYFTDGQVRGGDIVKMGAAGAVRDNAVGESFEVRGLLAPSEPYPTEKRAKLAGIMLALENAVKRRDELAPGSECLRLYIHSDSSHAIELMKHWIGLGKNAEWKDSWGRMVADKDIMERAANADAELCQRGTMDYMFSQRGENWRANEVCNNVLDLMLGMMNTGRWHSETSTLRV